MPWEQRGSRRYYYRKKRQGNRVVSEYIGNDMTAQVISEVDRLDRARLLNILAAWQELKFEFKSMEQEYEFLQNIIRGLVHATYLTSGYHNHKGQWRKTRHE